LCEYVFCHCKKNGGGGGGGGGGALISFLPDVYFCITKMQLA